MAAKSLMGSAKGVARKNPKNAMRFQLVWTLCGFSVLFVCLIVMGSMWVYFNGMTDSSTEVLSTQFRNQIATTLSLELAALLRPLYTLPRRFAYQAKFTNNGSINAMLTKPEFYEDVSNLNILEPILFPTVARDTHLRSVSADGSIRSLNYFIGSVVALSLDEHGQPSNSWDTCNKTLHTSLVLDGPDPTSNSYLIDFQGLNKTTGHIFRELRAFDSDTCTVGPAVAPLGLASCMVGIGSLWSSQARRPVGSFDNFTWFGPQNPGIGWGNHLEGSVPLYDDDMNEVGRFSSAISLGKSVGPLLQEVILNGGEVTRGGHAAVYTASALVIGLSEPEASPPDLPDGVLQAPGVDDVVKSSMTGAALQLVRDRLGSCCPQEQAFLEADDTLVDVTPFSTEDFGMPPLGQRWCQLVVLPRDNIFKSADEASSYGTAISITALIGVIVAGLLVLRSLLLTYHSFVQMNMERQAVLRERVARARGLLAEIAVQMSLMSGNMFLGLKEPQYHENCRDMGMLRMLDTVACVRAFQAAGNIIVLFSHQWLGYSVPDNEDGVQLKAMQLCTTKIIERQPNSRVHVWLDYISVPQKHLGQMKLAINSLPTYVSLVNYFVICAPDATHRDSHLQCDLGSYSRRGWCRTEMLAKACSSGIRNMLICSGGGDELKEYTMDDFHQVSLKVFEGDFTERRDMEALVDPILGLYGYILAHHDADLVSEIRESVEREKPAFFPHTYQPDLDKEDTRPLFGPLVVEMERHVEHHQEDAKVLFAPPADMAKAPPLELIN